MPVVVNPSDANKVVVGGLDVYSSVNGGTTLTAKSSVGNFNSSHHFLMQIYTGLLLRGNEVLGLLL